MATFEASKLRVVAMELHRKVFTLYANLLPIVTELNDWTLNGLDPVLPSPYALKTQIDAYKALSLDRLKLEPWVTEIQQATIDDTSTYPPPPVYFDGGVTFDGGGAPEGEGT